MFTTEPGDVSDFAIRDQLARILAGRGADIVKANHIWHARGLCGSNHGCAVFHRSTQRFFTQNRFSQSKSCLSNAPVRFLRRGDHNGLDTWILDQRAPVVCGAGKAIGHAIALCRIRRGRANHLEARTQLGVEHSPDRGHRHRMRLAHIATTNDANADFQVCSPPRLKFNLQPVAKLVS